MAKSNKTVRRSKVIDSALARRLENIDQLLIPQQFRPTTDAVIYEQDMHDYLVLDEIGDPFTNLFETYQQLEAEARKAVHPAVL